MKNKRPKIPPKTQVKLWTLAAGRCEFFGCNKVLWRDDLTFSEGNYSNIAHIISWIPNGPRGDKILSPKLAKDISNLMLVCRDHGSLIDHKQNLSRFTVELLRTYKQNHEKRIMIQTSIKEELKTQIVRFQCNIRGRRIEVPFTDAYSGIIDAGRYPTDEKGILIDLTKVDYSADESFWKSASVQISNTITRELAPKNDGDAPSHFSIFGLAPIPLLIYLGYCLGSGIAADLYLRPHSSSRWYLNDVKTRHQIRIKVSRSNIKSKSKKIALIISLSGVADPGSITKGWPIYNIFISRPNVDSLKSQKDINVFRSVYRQVLAEIRDKYGGKSEVHIFAAVPPAAAILCGREVIHGVDPPLFLYEHGNQNGFHFVLKINNK